MPRWPDEPSPQRVIAPPDIFIDLVPAIEARRARVVVERGVLDALLAGQARSLENASALWVDLHATLPVFADTGWSGPAKRMFDIAVIDLVATMARASAALAEAAADTSRARDELRRDP